jgi:hypothetical protein
MLGLGMSQSFDRIEFVIEPALYPGKFCAKVLAWHRGVLTYEKVLDGDASFRATCEDLGAEVRIVKSMFDRGKFTADPTETPPTTRIA